MDSSDKDEALKMLLDLAGELGRAPSRKDFADKYGVQCCNKIWRNWNHWPEFVTEAGLDAASIKHCRAMFSDAELFKMVNDLAEKLGRVPSRKDFLALDGMFSGQALNQRFGPWCNFLKAAGLKQTKCTDAYLIRQAKMLTDKLGRTPSPKDFDENVPAAKARECVKRFGSWKNYLAAAGLRRRKYTKAELIRQLQEMTQELGRVPTSTEFNVSRKSASTMSCVRQFGSWNHFLEAAGLPVIYNKRVS